VNQTNPPNQNEPGQYDPNNPYGQQDNSQSQNTSNQGANPYTYQQTATPDLDANAPTLSSNELQRLNRKAIFFLVGFVVLLLMLGTWLFTVFASGGDEQVKVKEETVTVPTLPDAPPAVVEEPIPLAEPTVILPPQLPPPPPQDVYDPQPPKTESAAVQPRGPTLMERRMLNEANEGGTSQQPAVDPTMQAILDAQYGGKNPKGSENKSESADATSAQFLTNADSLLVRGTYIRCVLETRIITDVAGFTSCIVTEPVYSINGRRLLLPKGSKISGSYDVEDPKINRVAVVWDRITTPNGIDVSMSSPGVDNLGSAGHIGQYNAHWASKITSALLISLVSDAFKYAGEKNGPTTETVTTGGQVITSPYQSNTARTMERIAEKVVERNLSRPATVIINQGTVVNVYVAKDVSFVGVVAR
jgi:type IV secretion system protein VirB10